VSQGQSGNHVPQAELPITNRGERVSDYFRAGTLSYPELWSSFPRTPFERSRWRDGRFACYVPHARAEHRASVRSFVNHASPGPKHAELVWIEPKRSLRPTSMYSIFEATRTVGRVEVFQSGSAGSCTLVVQSQLYTAGALVGFYAYTIGKLPNHKGR
jgi:hypothetical protein